MASGSKRELVNDLKQLKSILARRHLSTTYVEIWRVSFDANLQMATLYIDRKVFCSHASRNWYVDVHFGQRLIPLVDHSTVMRERVSLTWSKSFSAHRLRRATSGSRFASLSEPVCPATALTQRKAQALRSFPNCFGFLNDMPLLGSLDMQQMY